MYNNSYLHQFLYTKIQRGEFLKMIILLNVIDIIKYKYLYQEIFV